MLSMKRSVLCLALIVDGTGAAIDAAVAEVAAQPAGGAANYRGPP